VKIVTERIVRDGRAWWIAYPLAARCADLDERISRATGRGSTCTEALRSASSVLR
jgi:hypothetical protein